MNHDEQSQALEQQFRSYEAALSLLAPALGAAVPLYMLRFQQHGGIADTDVARVQSYLQDVTAHGNDLYYRNKKWGETAERFDQVAEIIAVLSFFPGGITVFGLHFDAHTLPAQKQQASTEEAQNREEG